MSKELVQVIYVSIGSITLAALGLMGCNFDSSQTDAMGQALPGRIVLQSSARSPLHPFRSFGKGW